MRHDTSCPMQIALGMALGWVAAEWAVCPAPSKPSQAQAAIAASVASTVGAPSLAPSLYPEPASAPAGMRAVVQTASTFGNSLTIPLLFMLSLYPASLSSLASGSVALVLLGVKTTRLAAVCMCTMQPCASSVAVQPVATLMLLYGNTTAT